MLPGRPCALLRTFFHERDLRRQSLAGQRPVYENYKLRPILEANALRGRTAPSTRVSLRAAGRRA